MLNLTSDTNRPTRSPRRRMAAGLAAGLATVALAVPTAAIAYPVQEPSSSAAQTGTSLPLNRGHDSTKAGVALAATQPVVQPVSTTTTAGGSSFNWGDAAIGAGAVLALAAVAGAGLGIRRRETIAPRSAASAS